MISNSDWLFSSSINSCCSLSDFAKVIEVFNLLNLRLKGGADVLWSLFNGSASSNDLSLPPCTARTPNIYVDIDMIIELRCYSSIQYVSPSFKVKSKKDSLSTKYHRE
ncbi:hypothetical protein WUBG_12674 [Wuchereria bancrofti]|uniref:Uncharacterized protein n=1 Tax=Wuchereria bancrofti TaxID=6293 RepID=J9EHB6_WUCBA|nr:hypothetical protein WUBG_12674 [Wuchereria bancrofti]